jgi:hypothetical protein
MNFNVFQSIIIPLLSAALGALLTFWYQKRNQKIQNKLYILANLMAYRHAGPREEEFVKCLNMVDIVFHNNKKVKELTHKYFEYTSSNIYSGGQRITTFLELLIEMGRDIGYKDLKHSDVKDFYTPSNPEDEGAGESQNPPKS